MAKLTEAKPVAAVGDTVSYYDRQHRFQTGKVQRIEASWNGWGDGEPLIIYAVGHPTYRNRHCYITADCFVGRALIGERG